MTHRLSPARAGMRALSLTAVSALTIGLLTTAAPAQAGTAAPAQAGTAAPAATTGAAQTAAGWLAEQFTAGTHLQSSYDGVAYDDPGLTADGILALDAAKVGGVFADRATKWLQLNVDSYVGDGATESYAGALAKTILVAQAAGLSATSFNGRNLIADLEALQNPTTGRFSDKSAYGDYSSAITQSLAIIAERRAGRPAAIVGKAVTWLIGLECGTDRGFPLYPATGTCAGDTDASSYAAQALSDSSSTDRQVRDRALGFLAARQGTDGGLPGADGTENANSTGLAAVAFALAGQTTFTAAAAKAGRYLHAAQQTAGQTSTGAVNYQIGSYQPSTAVRATTQGAPGLTAYDDPTGAATIHNAAFATVSRSGSAVDVPVPAVPTGAYRAVPPSRLLDTRQSAALAPGKSITVSVGGRAGVPTDASAVAVNITAVLPTGPGNVTTYPAGAVKPNTSVINLSPGVTLAAATTVRIGTGGAIVLANNSLQPLNLLLDVSGYVTAGAGEAAGAYRSVAPVRLLDTRHASATPSGAATVPAGGSVSVQIAGASGLPLTDVLAAAVTVTAVQAAGPGNVAAFPAGTAAPGASTLNLVAGATVANGAVVRLGADGRITLLNNSPHPLDLLLDVVGYYLGGIAQFSGTFTAVPPARVLDTRSTAPVAAHGLVTVAAAGRDGVPTSGVAALAYNLTAVMPAAPGNVTAFPASAARPATSALNLTPGRTVANQAVTGVNGGSFTLFNDGPQPLNLLVDLAGYYRQ